VKAYIRSITPKAWYLIGCSIAYLLTIVVLMQFFSTEDAIFYAQIFFVFILTLGLAVLKTYRWYQRR
jgi:lipid-A-disaccharide synthase-like uncharacterized protein